MSAETVSETKKDNTDRNYLLILFAVSSVAFIAGLSRSGYAYTYYSAATQSASKSWKAFFYASFDSANFMTVDKPPVAIWISSIFTRVFGFSSFWILLPHALAGVACTLLLYKIVRRQFDSKTACIASILFLITPVTSVVFRYNITDSFLTLFLLLSIYAFLIALEKSQLKWLVYSSIALGFAFNTKMAQGLFVVPIFVLIYLVSAQKTLILKIRDLAVFIFSTVIFSMWWVLIVALTPASERPYIGSSRNNSIWQLVFVHNGFGRLFGSQWKQPTGSRSGIAFGGEIGVVRIFNQGFGPNFAWFSILAIAGALLYLWIVGKSENTRMSRLQVLIWIYFVLIHIFIFSITKGTIHPYYVVVIAPACAALCSISVSLLWSKDTPTNSIDTAQNAIFLCVVTSIAIFVPLYLFGGPSWAKNIGIVGLVGAFVSMLGFIYNRSKNDSNGVRNSIFIGCASLCAIPLAMSIANIISIPHGFVPTTQPIPKAIKRLTAPYQAITPELKEFLLENYNGQVWIAATTSSIEGAPIQLSTGKPVMAVGGFSAEDDSLSVNEFKKLVAQGKVRYFVLDKSQRRVSGLCPQLFLVPQKPGTSIGKDFRINCPGPQDENAKSTKDIVEWSMQQKYIGFFPSPRSQGWDVYELGEK